LGQIVLAGRSLMARMLSLAAVATVLAVAPAFHFPAAAADTSVPIDLGGPFARIGGRMTRIPSSAAPVLHRVDDQRFVVVEYLYAKHVYDRASGTVTPLMGNVRALAVGDALVLLLEQLVCDIDPGQPALRVLDSPGAWPALLSFDGSRLVFAVPGAVHVVRAGAPARVLPLPEGFSVPPGNDPVRGDRIIVVRPGALLGATRSWDHITYAKPVPWTMEVAVFDVATGTFTPPSKVPGRWRLVIMDCCSGWEPSTFIAWMDAAAAREHLRAAPPGDVFPSAVEQGGQSAVVDEWNEVITWGSADLFE
jgi:hypothetical protein